MCYLLSFVRVSKVKVCLFISYNSSELIFYALVEILSRDIYFQKVENGFVAFSRRLTVYLQ